MAWTGKALWKKLTGTGHGTYQRINKYWLERISKDTENGRNLFLFFFTLLYTEWFTNVVESNIFVGALMILN